MSKRLLALLVLLLAARGAHAQFTSAPACADGIDNDGDGKIDYSPVPGEGDPGCDAWNDPSEEDLTYSPLVRPRLAIVFDTSGSMVWNVCTTNDTGLGYTGGDGSLDCPGHDVPCCNQPPGPPMQCVIGGSNVNSKCDSSTCGNGLPDDARIHKVKQGVHDAVAAYGEMEYSLYRFHADPIPFVECADVNPNGQGGFGGWQGAPSATTCEPSDLLVKFSPENQRFILEWMDESTNWAGASPNPPPGLDFELRATGFTPLGASLDQVRIDIGAIRAADSQAGCRPYRVVLVTDGRETCGGDPVAAARALRNANAAVYVIGFAGNSSFFVDQMNAIADAGGTDKAYFADDPETLSAALADIVAKTVLVETCNGLDDDCDGVVDNGFQLGPCDNGQLGACFRQGHYVCVSPTATACDAPHVTPPAQEPPGCNGIDDDCDGVVDDGLTCAGCAPEICNGIDDDCDGVIDNPPLPGVGDPCGLSQGECKPGAYACEDGRLTCKGGSGPSTEICDGKDNDCDGVVDQLTRACYDFASGCIDTDPSAGGVSFACQGRCRAGTQICTVLTEPGWSACSGDVGPAPERCNGVDDDCDGVIDDGFEARGQPCTRGTGPCLATGKLICSPDGTQLVCDAPLVTGVPEICNGVDDDCNGTVDDLPDPPPPPIGQPCGTCGGVYQCRGGLVCAGGSSGPEVCNGKDDDCNGVIDDGILPGVGEVCVPEEDGVPQFTVTGECRAGRQQCIAGALACVGFTGPQPEVCNGKDDDCDGVIDDAADCPLPSQACYQGQCVAPCAEDEFPCPYGFYCRTLTGGDGRFCVPNRCVGRSCPPGQTCDRETGECKDPCAGMSCPDGEQCREGECVDCFVLGCAAGTVCVDTGGRGRCQTDRCAGVGCAVGEQCTGGSCVAVACPAGCPAGQRCDEGRCAPSCTPDLCAAGGKTCPAGTACNPLDGRCLPDPCAHASCGAAICVPSCDGAATCVKRATVDLLATGGGGFQCEIAVASRGSPGLLALLLAVMVALLRRRRRA